MRRNRRGARRIREDKEYQAYHEARSGCEPMKQAEGGGFIARNDPGILDFSNDAFSIDMLVDCIQDKFQ